MLSPFACRLTALLATLPGFSALAVGAEPIDFNRDIRPILSNVCLKCHGPDENERQGGIEGLRLDTREGALADLGAGDGAVIPGNPDDSELMRRVTAAEADERMPPPGSGKQLTPREVELLREWIRQGAEYAKHWSYVPPTRPSLPKVSRPDWPRNPIDCFLMARLDREKLQPTAEADRYALIRRLSLDLTGLPPTLDEVDAFVHDAHPDAYERLVQRILQKPAFGEHWARMWLDLARYADSAGYADDPPRMIWAYRDYVIRSLNENKPFDQFTVEQLAGDLLPEPTNDQLIATAFHRNTLTNSEGGTNDEEFRNVAIVDRVNTTWAVWMGTSMACAQCHTHKYDPLSQEEFFKFFAILNNTEDADRRDEAPLLEFLTDAQRNQQTKLNREIEQLDKTLRTPTPALLASLQRWEEQFPKRMEWQVPRPESAVSQAGAEMKTLDDASLLVTRRDKTDVYTVTVPLSQSRISALRLETLPHESLPKEGPGNSEHGNFVISRVVASVIPPSTSRLQGRFIRLELSGKEKILSLAEVQVFSGNDNIAPQGKASQSSTAFDGPAQLAIDGNTKGKYYEAKSVTHTEISENPWWELDLQSTREIDRIAIWNRTDPSTESRLAGVQISLLDDKRQAVWQKTLKDTPNPSQELETGGFRPIRFRTAFADVAQNGFDASFAVENPDAKKKGWAIGGAETGKPHSLTLVTDKPVDVPEGSKLTVTIEQLTQHEFHTVGCFRIGVSGDERVSEYARTPANVVDVLNLADEKRSDEQRRVLQEYYFAQVASELKDTRDRLAAVQQQLAGIKPYSVPILRELAEDKQRTTRLQYRGNFLDLGQEVQPGVPAVLHALPEGQTANRLSLAKWLVDPDNPLTARVLANRLWEQIFGIGLVRTSEEFGSQGELPSHPELLDWMAVELMESDWDLKRMVKLLVTSAAYRQSSKVTPELVERDPENRLVARGPRIRLSAEAVRDQALFVSGLLSSKMFGPSVKPPQPTLGLNAAFGSTIDWKPSDGADRYRRGLYTEWRRSNPYPSMITFDAPNREVCTIRRNRTNTPLQALVTLNDPVYVECAQSLARKIADVQGSPADKVRLGFRLGLAREPYEAELDRLVRLYGEMREDFAKSPDEAKQLATDPLGPVPDGMDVVDLASWTVVANVLLNLDEMLMKR